jgi:hypothetical protein
MQGVQMIYKDYTISAEERVFNLLEVNQRGEITSVMVADDWSQREYEFCVFSGEGLADLAEIGFTTIEEAKSYVDEQVRLGR